MIGLIATTATMSAMAAPSFDHKNPPPAAHFDKKPMPPKGDFRKAPPKPHFNQKDRHDKFDKKDHKGFFKQDKKYDDRHDRKAPPMSPKHR